MQLKNTSSLLAFLLLLCLNITTAKEFKNDSDVVFYHQSLNKSLDDFEVNYIEEQQGVSILTFEGNYDKSIGGAFNVEARQAVLQEFYQQQNDDYDFVFIFTDFEFDTDGLAAFANPIKNNVAGIGKPIFDNCSAYFSNKLKSVIDMNTVGHWQFNPANNEFDTLLDAMIHEMMHSWGVSVTYMDSQSQESDRLLGLSGNHWSYFLNSQASVMYGSLWNQIQPGTFRVDDNLRGLSPLDLYLAGFIPKQQVPDMFLIADASLGLATDTPSLIGTEITGTTEVITIEDIIASVGERVPDYQSSQHEFKVKFILLTQNYSELGTSVVSSLSTLQSQLQKRFYAETSGLGKLDFARALNNLNSSDPDVLEFINDNADTFSTTKAVNFILIFNQLLIGNSFWEDKKATRVKDTVTVINSLMNVSSIYPIVADPLNSAIFWLNNYIPRNNDERAWMLLSGVINNNRKQDLINDLIAAEHETGGWGLDSEMEASPYDTVLVINALYSSVFEYSINSNTRQFILDNINSDGGFSYFVGGESNITSSSLLLHSINKVSSNSQHMTDLASYIIGQALPDNTYGNDGIGTPHETALVLIALESLQEEDYLIQINLSKSALNRMQSIDGSMQGSFYSTALAMNLLNSNDKANLLFSQVHLSNENIIEGEQITVNFEIHNSGILDASNIEVTAYKDSLDVNNQVGHIVFDLLISNQVVNSSLLIDTNGFNYNSELILVIDKSNTIEENSEIDNTFTASLVVQQSNSDPELAFNTGGFSYSPSTFDVLPFTLNGSVIVSNLSTEKIDNVFVALFKTGTNGMQVLLETQEVNILALSGYELNFSTEITQATTDIPLILKIDPDNNILERNEYNNTHSFKIFINQSIDLKITSEDVSLPIEPIIGETQNISFNFNNSGTISTSGFDVRVYSEVNSEITLIHQSHVNELSSGEQLTRNLTWLPIIDGLHNLRFVLDEPNELIEVDETNNEVVIPVLVGVNSLSNLLITDNDIVMSPDPGLEGQDIRFTVNLHNNSNLASGDFQIDLSKKNAAGVANTLLATKSVANINANDSLIVDFDLQGTNLRGENDLIFSVDSTNSVEEFSETDNLVIKRFRILEKADAFVSAGSFHFTPSTPVLGESLTVAINISNNGEQSLEQLEANLYYVDSQQDLLVLIETKTIPLLVGGETQTSLYTFVMPNNIQIDTFIIKLDESEIINEANEDNNQASVLVGTQDQMLYVTQRYFSPNGDGVKDQTSIVFNAESVGNYSIEIVDERKRLIKSFNSQLFENTNYGDVVWDGRNNNGILARDGDFNVNLLDHNSSVIKSRLVTLDTNRSSLFKSNLENNGYNTDLSVINNYSNINDAKLSHDGKYLYITSYEDNLSQTHNGLFALKADGSEIDPIVPVSLFGNANYIEFALLDNGNLLLTFEQNGSYKMFLINIITGDYDLINDYSEYIDSAQEIYAYTPDFAIVKGAYDSYLKVYFDTSIPPESVDLYDSKVEHVLKNGLILSHYISNEEGPPPEPGSGSIENGYNLFFISFEFNNTPQQIANLLSIDEYNSMKRSGSISADGRNFVFRKGEVVQVYQAENNNLATTFNKIIGINNNYGFNSHNELYVLNLENQSVSIFNELGILVMNSEATLIAEDFDPYLVDIHEVQIRLENGYTFSSNIADMQDFKLHQEVISYTDYSDEKEIILLTKSSLIGEFETPECDDTNIPCSNWIPLTETPIVELSRLIKINYQDLSHTIFQSSDLGDFQDLAFSDIQEGRSRYVKTVDNKFIDRYNLSVNLINSEVELSKPVNPIFNRAEIFKLASDKNSLLYYSRNNLYANIWLSIQESAIKIQATTFDWNFDKYEIYWSLSSNPEDWNFIYTSNQLPNDQSTVLNWVPNQSGKYNIKFIAYDKSGNRTTSIEEITISNVDTSIRNVSVEPKYFSPNGDGNKDFVNIEYDADAANVLINISDEVGNIVRTYQRQHQNSNEHELIQWDGKNLAGELLDDGIYIVSVQGIDTEVALDTIAIPTFDVPYYDNPTFLNDLFYDYTVWLDKVTPFDIATHLKLFYLDYSSSKMQIFEESTNQWHDAIPDFISLKVDELILSGKGAIRRYIAEDKAGNTTIFPALVNFDTYPITQLLKVTYSNEFLETKIETHDEQYVFKHLKDIDFPSPRRSPKIVDWTNGEKIAYVIQAKSYNEFDKVILKISYWNDFDIPVETTKNINILTPTELLKYKNNSTIGGNLFIGNNSFNSNLIDIQLAPSQNNGNQFQVPAFLIELEKNDFPDINKIFKVTFEGINSVTNETIFNTKETHIRFKRDPILRKIKFNLVEDLYDLPNNAIGSYENMLNSIIKDSDFDYFMVYEFGNNIYDIESLAVEPSVESQIQATVTFYEPSYVDRGDEHVFRLFKLPRSRCQDNLRIYWEARDIENIELYGNFVTREVIKAKSNDLETSRCVDIEIASYLGEFCESNPHDKNEFTFSVFASQADPLLEPPVLIEVYVKRIEHDGTLSLIPAELIFSDTNPIFSINEDLSLDYYSKFDFDIASVMTTPTNNFKVYAIMTDLDGNQEISPSFALAYNRYFQDFDLKTPTSSTLYCGINEKTQNGLNESSIIIEVEAEMNLDFANEIENPPLTSYGASSHLVIDGQPQTFNAEHANNKLNHQTYVPILERVLGNTNSPVNMVNRYFSQETGYFDRIVIPPFITTLNEAYQFKKIPEYEGPATFIFQTLNISGRNYCNTVDIVIDNLINIDVVYQLPDIANGVVSPNGDGRFESILLSTIQVYEQIDITAELYQFGILLGEVINQDLIDNEIDNLIWDGRLNGVVVDDGNYEIKTILEDACGNQHSFVTKVRVDTKEPTSVFIDPLDGGFLNTIQRVLIEVDEESTHEVEYQYNNVWNSLEVLSINYNEGSAIYEVELNWNLSNHPIDTYPIRIHSEDLAGNRNTTQINPILEEINTIFWNYSLIPLIISPNGDSIKDDLKIEFGLNVNSNVSINIYDSSLSLVKDLSFNQLFNIGAHQILYNGMDDSNNQVADGVYSVEIIANEIDNINNSETLTLPFTIDNRAPNIQWISPDSSIFKGDGLAQVRLQELNPYSFEIYNQKLLPLSNIEPILSVNNADTFDLFELNELDESQYQLTAYAVDRAGNSTNESLIYKIDKTPPNINLISPLNDDIVGGSDNILNISGQIQDLNFDHYEIALAEYSEIPIWQTIHSGTELIGESFTNDWLIAVNDGAYKLRLLAEDKAGWITETIIDIVIDTTPPIAIISDPINNQIISSNSNFLGIANDENLKFYSLFYKLVNTDIWQVMNIDEDVVENGILGSFPIGVISGLYNVKLVVIDAVDLESETQITIELDAEAPAIPANLTIDVINQQVSLHWDSVNSSDFTGYLLYRNGEIITTPVLTINQYLDTSVTNGEYVYTVTSIDSRGNESEHSNEVMATIDTIPPNVNIFSPNNGQLIRNTVEITGTALSLLDFNEFRLYYRLAADSSPGILINQSPIPVTNGLLGVLDTTSLLQDQNYIIRLEASDNSNNIAVVERSVFVDNIAPSAPLNLTHQLQNINDVLLQWDANSESDLAGYLVFHNGNVISGTGDGNIVVGNAITDISHIVEDLVDGTHTFKVAAIDLTGNLSGFSNSIEQIINIRAPDTIISSPLDNSKFQFPISFIATSDDLDISSIKLEYSSDANNWTSLVVDAQAPYQTTINPQTLGWSYGNYYLRATATDTAAQTDITPAQITIEYADITPPQEVQNVNFTINGGDISIDWEDNIETDLAGYMIYRIVNGIETLLTGTPINTSDYIDFDLDDSLYTYKILAIDNFDNESISYQLDDLKVFSIQLEQPYSPVLDSSLVVFSGRTGVLDGSIQSSLNNDNGVNAVSDLSISNSYTFSYPPLPLAHGDNSLTATQSLNSHHFSKSTSKFIQLSPEPAVPNSLQVTTLDYINTLTWLAAEVDTFGYLPYKNGTAIFPISEVNSGINYDASSNQIDAPLVSITDPHNYWQPSYEDMTNGTETYIELSLNEPKWVVSTDLKWLDDFGDKYNPSNYKVQYHSSPGWITIAEYYYNDPVAVTASTEVPYLTDKIRILITARFGLYETVLLEEVHINHRPLTSSLSLNQTESDGVHSYQISAINKYGFESELSSAVEAFNGDVIAPDPVTLSGTTSAMNDVQLNWNASIASDVNQYWLFRNDELIMITQDETVLNYSDVGLVNGHYDYYLKVSDLVGNLSQKSNIISFDIQLEELPVIENLQIFAPVVGSVLELNWQEILSNRLDHYNIYRSQIANGPYDHIASSIANDFQDSSVENGVRYYYVVTMADSFSNEGGASNQVSAIAQDQIPPEQPVILTPTKFNQAITINSLVTDVTGIADPGVWVDLYVNDNFSASVRSETESGLISTNLNTEITNLSLSKKGDYYAYTTSNSELIITNKYSNQSITQYMDANSVFWNDIGTILYVVYFDDDLSEYKLSTFDLNGNKIEDLFSSDYIYSAIPSNNENYIVFEGDYMNSYGFWLYEIATLTTTSIVSDEIYTGKNSVVWSPDSNNVAFINSYSSGELFIYNINSQSTILIDTEFNSDNILRWSMDNQYLLYEKYDSDKRLILYQLSNSFSTQIPSLNDETLAGDFSPDNTKIIFNDGCCTLSKYTIDTGAVESLYPITAPIYNMVWNVNDGIELVTFNNNNFQASYHQTKSPGGFSFNSVNLETGINQLHVLAREDSGLESQASLPIQIEVSSTGMADIFADSSKLIISPTAALSGSEFNASAIIKNTGDQDILNTQVQILLVYPDGNRVEVSNSSLNLSIGQSKSIYIDLGTLSLVGDYQLEVLADSGNILNESDETNNFAISEFKVLASLAPQLTTFVSPTQLAPSVPLLVEMSVFNPGQVFNGRVYLQILDESNFPVISGEEFNIQQLEFGATVDFSYSWNTEGIYAGDYKVIIQLIGFDGSLITQKVSDINLRPFSEFQLSLNIDSNIVRKGQNTLFTAQVNYLSGNSSENGQLMWRLLDDNNQILWNNSSQLPLMLPDYNGSFYQQWLPQNIGSYIIQLQLQTDHFSRIISLPITVLPTAANPNLIGVLDESPNSIVLGDDLMISYQLSNTGNIDLNNTDITVKLLTPDLTQEIDSASRNTSLVSSQTVTLADLLSTQDLIEDNYLLALYADMSGQGGSTEQLLDTRTISAIDITAPLITIESPLHQALYSNQVDVLFRVMDQHGHLENIQMQHTGNNTKNFNINRYDDLYQHQLFNLSHGPHEIIITAEDQRANKAQQLVSFEVDSIAPIININGVLDNVYYNTPIIANISINDDHLSSTEILLNSVTINDFNPMIDSEGHYLLRAIASDSVANRSSKSVSFVLDFTPPTVIIDYPISGSQTTDTLTNVIGSTERLAWVYLSSGLYQDSLQADNNGNFSFNSIPLELGLNSISLYAIDLANNQGLANQLDVSLIEAQNLQGTISADNEYALGEDINLSYQLNNLNSSDLLDIIIKIELSKTSNGELLSEQTQVNNILASQVFNSIMSFSSLNMETGNLTAELSVFINNQWQHLSSTSLVLSDQTAPSLSIISPEHQSVYNTQIEAVIDVTDEYSEIESVEIEINQSGDWLDMIQTGESSYNSSLQLNHGTHTILFRAQDTSNNSKISSTIEIDVDTMAPLINVNYPTNGLVTNQPITLDFNVTDDHQFTIQAQLNGQDISAGFVVSQDGIHNLEFIATDEVGNSSSKSIQFRLDQQAPLIQILNVSNEQQYLESLIDIQGITEVNSQVHLTIGALELQTQANNLGEFNFDQVELQLGANDLIFNATDIASNSAQSVSLRVYYSLAESCEIFGFSTASPYNIWVQGDYMAQSTSVSGRLASGGDLLIDYYSIGQSLNSETAGDVLVVGGDINFNHGQVYFGNILAAGSTEAIGQDVINNMAFGAQILGNANLPIDFNQTQKDLYLFSNALNDEANTGSILRVDQELKLIGNCNSNSGMHVFNLAAQDLSGVNSITYECLAAQTYAIINISGDQVEFINLDSSSFSSIRQHVLYNISQANQVLLYNSQIHGSIMAPYATIRSENSLVSDLIFTNGFDSNNNKIFGQVIANSWESNAEIHSSDFACGNLQLNSAPIARDITFDGFINTPIVIGLVVLDEQIESLQYQLISSPDFGQISGSWPNISYTPNLNYSGTDQFIYTVTDSQGQMGQATVTIIISDDIIFKDNFEEVFQMIGSLLPLQLFYITSYFLSDEFELINKANFLWRRS